MSLSDRLVRAWYAGHPALGLLRPLECLYRRISGRRRSRFLAGEGDIYRAPVPVIVVGNITVGGTGKTPMILWLIEHCRRRGLRVGVVSRGYGAHPPALPWRVEAGQPARQCGDEPLLIANRCGVPLYIDPDRGRAIRALLAAEPVDLILCDDGLQHYRLARDLELVLIDAVRGLGNGRCLPAGPLREPRERLLEVDAVLFNGGIPAGGEGYELELRPSDLVELASGRVLPLAHFPPGQRLHAVAGIGNPQRFFATLERLDWRPIAHPFADHASYTPEQLSFSPELPLVMTEKDAVKCQAFAPLGWTFLRVQACPSAAFVAWFDDQLSRLCNGRTDPKGRSNGHETA
ncbi:tetraacyldisaccharide 4'-kinase [Stutzerimonas kirkiae]|uniref:Tetraacyldisaccharide 4'-kinase n=1 Tax=Stutzerimonas kirkiae TaxID=2211392 RepID=A0A4Q9RBW8_9GAMM|nr:tetraacyldisaccharide 4'-kinase [Stutzerimonas kirkiae]TBU97745.1 tetraacyldisaccharide 4'-kinase [Stutzerimonas kirkiae]TBV04904.1 tetraacyldisaccharide 4'-kinase [Stutzerimonas kirkiae]TBV12040.1 tetraacyldisaccharide 4'-kinase [Stutzerimonas kirkiae]TBV14951.1 tetraacyldisaccharide 4'-kinase [Stutzerimonas kirkiae]